MTPGQITVAKEALNKTVMGYNMRAELIKVECEWLQSKQKYAEMVEIAKQLL